MLIITYLVVLVLVLQNTGLASGDIPKLETYLKSYVPAVLVVILAFSYLDYRGGSIGKRVVGLRILPEKMSFFRSLWRNFIKFLPYQLAHYFWWSSPIG